jgi:hypothetical protein
MNYANPLLTFFVLHPVYTFLTHTNFLSQEIFTHFCITILTTWLNVFHKPLTENPP